MKTLLRSCRSLFVSVALVTPVLFFLSATASGQVAPASEATLKLRLVVDDAPTDLRAQEIKTLPDGRFWLPYFEDPVAFDAVMSPEAPGDRIRLEPARTPTGAMPETGSFIRLERYIGAAGAWRPVDAGDADTRETGFAVPIERGGGLWRFQVEEIAPPPTKIDLVLPPTVGGSLTDITPPVLGGGGLGAFAPEPPTTPGALNFNPYIFEERIHQFFEGQVKGYAAVIGNQFGIRGKVSGGWARDPADGGVRMTTFRPSNIGSVSKLYAGVALMHLLEQLNPNDLDAELDKPVWTLLPQRWHNGNGDPQISEAHKAITFRQLLAHNSGLDERPEVDNPDFFAELSSFQSWVGPLNFVPGSVGPGAYENENYRTMMFLIARLAAPNVVLAFETGSQNMAFTDYLITARNTYGLAYENYMKDVFFPLVEGPFAPSCDPDSEYQADGFALMYEDANDTSGNVFNQKASIGTCRAQGGYYSSAQEIFRFLHTLKYTENLLFAQNFAMLEDRANGWNSWLVLNQIIGHPGFNTRLGINPWYAKDGVTRRGNRGTAIAQAMLLPYEWVGSLVYNSDGPTDGAAHTAYMDAFFEATAGTTATISREAMTFSSFLETVAVLRNFGMEVQWLDLHDVGGTPYVNAVFGPGDDEVAGLIEMNGTEFQAFIDEWVEDKGYALKQVESYLKNGKIRYAAIITSEPRPQQVVYQGATWEEHIDKATELADDGYAPINISVVSKNGQRYITALWEKSPVNFQLRSQLTTLGYGQFWDEMRGQGYRPVAVNAYRHEGEIFIAAAFHALPGWVGTVNTRDRDLYRAADATWLNAGRVPLIITGVDSGNANMPNNERHRFTAVWEVDPDA